MRSRYWPLCALVALFVPAGDAQPSDPTAQAETIVLGSVLSQSSYWTPDGLIYSDFIVTPAVTLKGPEHAALVVQVAGGRIGDTEMTLSHAPELKPGDRLLLFLQRSHRRGDSWEVARAEDGVHAVGSPNTAAVAESVFRRLEANGQRLVYKRSLAEAFLLTSVTSTSSTAASCYASTGVKWPTGSVTYKLAASVPPAWAASIQAAAATWSTSGAAFSLTSSFSSTNELAYLDVVAKYGSAYANTYALATTWTNTTTNRITKATIEINNRFGWSTTAQAGMADVQNILTHEFGHWLRLGDIYDPTACSEVTMWGTSPLGETKKRTLEQADINGVIGLYGRAGSIAAPVLTSPANGATGVSTGTSLTWSAASGATAYDVYFGTSAAPVLVATTAGTSYRPGAMAPGTTYHWRIVAKNATASATSPTQSFTTANGTLAAPVLLSPANGATGISRTPVLSWTAVSGGTAYDIYFGTSATPTLIGTVTGTSATVSGLQALTTYYWKVVARSTSGQASSAVWSFRTY